MADLAGADVVLANGRRLSDLRVADLKEELSKRRLTIKGLKSDLVERLREVMKIPLDTSYILHASFLHSGNVYAGIAGRTRK